MGDALQDSETIYMIVAYVLYKEDMCPGGIAEEYSLFIEINER